MRVINGRLAPRESIQKKPKKSRQISYWFEGSYFAAAGVLCFTPTKSENNEEVDVNKCSKWHREDSWVLDESRRHAAFFTCAFLAHSTVFMLPRSHRNKECTDSEMCKEIMGYA